MMAGSLELSLPRLLGSRPDARQLVNELGNIEDCIVVLNARDLRSASPSAVDELVKAILSEAHAATLKLAGGSEDLIEDLTASAEAHGVSENLSLTHLASAS